ncbi:MAG TPA: lytic transglycosylase domain-containing protein [Micromonosporaceae bacterium]|nr:lytic transglycosylase domain-containing protein [Micromonosporaceae bacterium]
MSRLWSRFGARTLAVGLLLAGVTGGFLLPQDRQAQEQGREARLQEEINQAEATYLKQRHAAYLVATAGLRAAEYEAATKAAEAAKAEEERARRAEAEASRKKREAARQPPPYTGPIPASCEEYSGNRKIGCAILLDSGFGLEEMPCLDKLWTKESGWNHKARNRSSGAYGIPQALPGSKMSTAGDDWEINPATQIKWGMGYIKGRYGTPCKAWEHSQRVGWY